MYSIIELVDSISRDIEDFVSLATAPVRLLTRRYGIDIKLLSLLAGVCMDDQLISDLVSSPDPTLCKGRVW